jgi:hypothetical protein
VNAERVVRMPINESLKIELAIGQVLKLACRRYSIVPLFGSLRPLAGYSKVASSSETR